MGTRLLPDADPVAYNQLVNASVNSEGLVNGFWVSVLNFHFPTNAVLWSISPEVRTPATGRLDLFITRNTHNPFRAHPTVIFEGKSATGDHWTDVLRQLLGYAKTYATVKGQFIYMIGARGRECRFFRYKKDDSIEATYMSYDPGTRRVYYLDSGRAKSSDISTDQPNILAFIREIIQNPTPLMHRVVESDTGLESQMVV